MGCAPSRDDQRADGNGRHTYAGLICDGCCGAGGVQGQTPTAYQYGDENSSVPLPDGQGQSDYTKVHPTSLKTGDLGEPASEHTDVAASTSGLDLKLNEGSNVEVADTAPSADKGLEGGVKVKVDTPAGGSASIETGSAATDMKSVELVSGVNASSDAKRVYGHSETMPSSGGSSSATGQPPTSQRGQDVDTAPTGGAKTTTVDVSGKHPSIGGGTATSPVSGGVQAGEGLTSVVGADTSKPPMTGDLDVPPSASVSAVDEQTHLDHDAAPIMRLPVSKMAADPSGSRPGSASGSTSGSAPKFTASSPLAARSPAASAYVASLTTSKSSEVEHPRPKRTPRSGKVNSYVQAIETKNPSPAMKREDAGRASPAKVEVPGVGVPGAVAGVSVNVEGGSLPKTEGGVDASSVEVSVKVPAGGVSPSVDASSGGDVKVSVPGDDPKIEGEIPDAGASSSADAPSSDVKPKKRFPSFGALSFSSKGKKKVPGFSTPAVEASGSVPADASESNESVPALDVKVSVPDKSVSAPGASVRAPKVDVNVGESAMAPDAELSGDVPSAKLDASLPSTVSKADVEAKVGEVGSGGDVDAEVPGTPSVEVKKPKITTRITKMFKKSSSKGKVEEPVVPAGDAPAPDVSASVPVGVTVSAPSLAANVPGVEVPEEPSVGVGSKAPEEPSGSASVHKVPEDVPSIGKAEVSAPDVSGSVPSASISAPGVKINVCVPSVDADKNAPNVTMLGPNVGVPKSDISLPASDVPDINESASGANTTAREVTDEVPPAKMGGSLLSADVPDINESASAVNIAAREVTDVIPPPMMGGSLPSADFGGKDSVVPPGVTMSTSAPAEDVSAPVVKVDVAAPDVEVGVSAPSLGAGGKAPDVADIDESGSDVNNIDEIPSAKLDDSLPAADVKAPESPSAGAGMSEAVLGFIGGLFTSKNSDEPDGDVSAPDVDGAKMPETSADVLDPLPSASGEASPPSSPAGAVEVPGVESGLKGPGVPSVDVPFVGDKVDVSTPDVKVGVSAPSVDVGSMKDPEMPLVDLPSVGDKVDSTPDIKVAVSAPSVDTESLKEPKMPSVSDPSENAPFVSGDVDVSTLDVKAVVSAPSVNVGSLKDPEMQSVDVTSSGDKVDVSTPDIKVGVSASSVDVGSLKDPEIPSVSGPSSDVPSVGGEVDASIPDVKIVVSAPSADVTSVDGKEDASTPDVKVVVSAPPVDVTSVDGKEDASITDVKVVSAPSVDVPSVDGKVDASTPDLKVAVSAPPVDVLSVDGKVDASTPDVTVVVSAPPVDVPSVDGKLDASTPDVKVVVSEPPVDVPSVDGKVDASTPDVKVVVSEPPVDVPSVGDEADVSTPDVKVVVSAPSVDVCETVSEVSGGIPAVRDVRVSTPSTVPGIKPPDVSTEVPAVREVKVSTPPAIPGIKPPDLSPEVPAVREVKVSTPPAIPGIKPPDLSPEVPEVGNSGNLGNSEESISGSEAEATGSEVKGIKAENLDASSVEEKKLRKRLLRMFRLGKEKQEALEIKGSEPDVKMPEVSGDISPSASGDVSKPSAPVGSVAVPERSVDIPSVKTGMYPPSVKGHAPVGGVSVTASNVRVDVSVPSVDEGVKVPEIPSAGVPPSDLPPVSGDTSASAPGVSMPSVDVYSKAPDVSVDVAAVGGTEGSVDVSAPSVDLVGEVPEMPSASGPSKGMGGNLPDAPSDVPAVTGANVSVDVTAPSGDPPSVGGDVSVSVPSVSMPSADVSGKVPDVSVDITAVRGADVSVAVLAPSALDEKVPETSSVSGPPVDKPFVGGGISVSTPGVSMPSVDMGGKVPHVSVDVPAVDGASVEVSGPSVSGHGASIAAPGVEVSRDAKIDASAPSMEGSKATSDIVTTGVSAEVGGGEVDAKGSEVPSVDVKPKKGLFRRFFSSGKENVEVPDDDVSEPAVEVDVRAPSASIEVSGAKSDSEAPGMPSVSAPSEEMPSGVGGGASVAVSQESAGVSSPALVDVAGKVVEVSINVPSVCDVGASAPDVSTTATDVSLKAPDVSGPGVDASVPQDLNASADSTAAGASMSAKTDDIEGKTPDLSFDAKKPSRPFLARIKWPSVRGKIEAPDVDVPEPRVEVNVSAPSSTVDASGTEMPSARGAVPSLGGDSGLSAADLGLAPSVEVSKSSVDDVKKPKRPGMFPIRFSSSKGKMEAPDDEAPGVSAPLPEGSTPSADAAAPASSATVDLPGGEGGLKGPEVSVLSTEVEKPIKFFGVSVRKPSRRKIEKPSVGAPPVEAPAATKAPAPSTDLTGKMSEMPSAAGVSVDVSAPSDSAVSVSVPDMEASAPDVTLSAPGVRVSAPKAGASVPEGDASLPDVNTSAPGVKVSVDVPSTQADASLPSVEDPKAGVEDAAADGSAKVGADEVDIKAELPDAPTVAAKRERKGSLLGGLFGFNKTKVEEPEVNISSVPSVSAPEADVGGKVPEIAEGAPFASSAPSVDVSRTFPHASVDVATVKVDASSPDVKANAPEGGKEPDVRGNVAEVSVSSSVVKASAPEESVSEDVPSSKADVSLPSAEGHKTEGEDAAAGSTAKIGHDVDVPEDPPAVLNEKAPKKSGGLSGFFTFLKPKTESLKADTASPDGGAAVPDASVDAPSASVKVPDQGVGEDVSGVDVVGKLPDAPMTEDSVSAPEMPSVSVSVSTSPPEVPADVPPLAGKLPDAAGVEGSTSAPSVDLGSKLPDPSAAEDDAPSVDAPEVDAAGKSPGASGVDLPAADVSVKLPSVQATVKLPEVPVIESSAKDPDIASVDAPAAHVTDRPPQAPSIKVDVKTPEMKSADVTRNLPGAPPEGAEGSMSTPEVPSGMGISVDERSSEGASKMTAPDVCVEGKDVEVGAKMPSASVVAAGVFDSASGSDFHVGEADVPEPVVSVTAPSATVNLPDAEPETEARPTKLPEASASLGASYLLHTPGSKGRRTAARLKEKFGRLLPGKKPSASALEEIDSSPVKVGLDEGDKKDLAFDLQVAVEGPADAVDGTAANLSEKESGPPDDKPPEVSTKAGGEAVDADVTEHSPMAVARPVSLGGRRSGGRRLFSKYLSRKDKADASDVTEPGASVSATDAKMSAPTVELSAAKNVADESASLKISPMSKPDAGSEDAKSAELDSSRLSAAFDAAIGAADDEDTGGATTKGDLVPSPAEPEASPDGDSDLSQKLAAALDAAGVAVDESQAADEDTDVDVEAPVDQGSVAGGVLGFLFGGGEARHEEGQPQDEQVPAEETPAAGSEDSTPAAKSGSDVTSPLKESLEGTSRDNDTLTSTFSGPSPKDKVANEAAAESTSEQSEKDKNDDNDNDKNDGGFLGMIAETLGLMPSNEEENETAAPAPAAADAGTTT